MKKFITLSAIVAAAFIAAPSVVRAQDDSTNSAAAPAPAHKHGKGVSGKVSAVDATAMTLTVGEKTFTVTSDTKITKHKQPATLADIAVGDTVTVSAKKDGTATSITVAGKKAKAAPDNN
jgi:hypothetical protein